MNYINAKEILPDKLISEIQKYVTSAVIYIPNKSGKEKAEWGTKNGSRDKYYKRNCEIRELRNDGLEMAEIAKKYYLSLESVKKILK